MNLYNDRKSGLTALELGLAGRDYLLRRTTFCEPFVSSDWRGRTTLCINARRTLGQKSPEKGERERKVGGDVGIWVGGCQVKMNFERDKTCSEANKVRSGGLITEKCPTSHEQRERV